MKNLELTKEQLAAYSEAEYPYQNIRDIAEYEHSVELLTLHAHEMTPPDALPWAKTHGKIGFRPGEVTLWHGINGHGKSAVTTQVALWWALNNRPVCLASFEMLPVRTIERMLKQCAGNSRPTEAFIKDFFKRLSGDAWIYDKRDTVSAEILYAVMRYCHAELEVRHFFIDSLMKCVRGEDDYNGQKDFVGKLCEIAHGTGMHIHLVHHVRKGQTESIPSKFDAKGTGAITDQVDNVIAVWRNKEKEAKRAQGEADESVPDFLLVCDKQRNGGWEGRVGLWGDLETWHFRETQQQPWSKGYSLDRSAMAA